jgi:hypothetical protein
VSLWAMCVSLGRLNLLVCMCLYGRFLSLWAVCAFESFGLYVSVWAFFGLCVFPLAICVS